MKLEYLLLILWIVWESESSSDNNVTNLPGDIVIDSCFYGCSVCNLDTGKCLVCLNGYAVDNEGYC